MNRLQVTADNTLVFGWQPESTNELEQLAADITKELKSFYQLYQKIADELKALPDTSQPILHKIVPVIPDESDQAIDP